MIFLVEKTHWISLENNWMSWDGRKIPLTWHNSLNPNEHFSQPLFADLWLDRTRRLLFSHKQLWAVIWKRKINWLSSSSPECKANVFGNELTVKIWGCPHWTQWQFRISQRMLVLLPIWRKFQVIDATIFGPTIRITIPTAVRFKCCVNGIVNAVLDAWFQLWTTFTISQECKQAHDDQELNVHHVLSRTICRRQTNSLSTK